MIKSTLIKNVNIVNEGKVFKGDIRIKQEKISLIAPFIPISQDEHLVEGNNKYLIPGLIDDQVHFREPGLTHKGDIYSESRAAVAGGITSFIEMPNTKPQTTTMKKIEQKLEIASRNSVANYGFMFGGTNSNLDEIKKIDQNKVAGLKLFLGSSTGNMLVNKKEVIKDIFKSSKLVISVHCEDELIIRKNLNIYLGMYGKNIPFKFHPKIRSSEACFKSSSEAVNLALETGARLHVFHISTGNETKLFSKIPIEEKQITSEVCTHHLWFSDKDYESKGSKIKWNPAIKSKEDRNALWEALNEDRIDVYATDHAPHTINEKKLSYTESPSGGPLVQHGLLAMLDSVNKGKITLEKFVEKASHNPAKIFKIKKRGFLKENFYADMVLVDLEGKTKVTKNNIMYKCGWSPFEGYLFNSSILKTWVNGKLLYDKGKIIESGPGKKLEYTR
ncbi:MAG: dihydroorotase [Flavobacteriaceae bacterium]|nr:dihydroorotase [Flavobacteriaceae bacterium]|tara:strand:- start:398 stop:1735 length:1338 start_codon:yes stop_codon:yes gene_type:complete